MIPPRNRPSRVMQSSVVAVPEKMWKRIEALSESK